MTDVKQLFNDLDRLFTDVAGILRDAESMLEAQGFVSLHGNSGVGLERSSALNYPSFWYPGWVSRHYVRQGQSIPESPMLCVAVLLHQRADDDMKALSVPVVSAGVWRFAEGVAADGWFPWMAKAWVWGKEPQANGEFCSTQLSKQQATGRVAAWPLEHVVSAEFVEDRVVKALVTEAGSSE